MNMIVISPSGESAFTNLAYCSPSDIEYFPVSHSGLRYATVGESSYVLSISSQEGIESGHIALNTTQQKQAGVYIGDIVSVANFVPPEENFNLSLLQVEIEIVAKTTKTRKVDASFLTEMLKKKFMNQVMMVGQKVLFKSDQGRECLFTVYLAAVEGKEKSIANLERGAIERGMISSGTYFIYETSKGTNRITILNQCQIFKEFNLQKLGIGGLSAEFEAIFRRAFVSRLLPSNLVNKLGITHVKGMLLYGPPGTGKTLLARQIGKIVNGKEPKIVNGPEVLNCYIGESEKNVRELFADAEQDELSYGDKSGLHVLIFDEIDAICKRRSGSSRDSSRIHDNIVNTLLTKMDGVEPLNNILIIGLTNRKELLDDALLRPGRLEVQIKIDLPDEKGRLEILQIHTSKLREGSFLAADVNLRQLAARTKNYSGAEIGGVVKSALSSTINRQLSVDDFMKTVNEESIKVTMEDFLRALQDIRPCGKGASLEELNRCRVNGIVNCGDRHKLIYERVKTLGEQVKSKEGSSLVKCLLEGPSGTGKTALAATVAINSHIPYVKIISAESTIGLHGETELCEHIKNVFEEAYTFPSSIIILDDIEKLDISLISRTLWGFLTRLPPNGNKLLVIGTTSEFESLISTGFAKIFSHTYHVPRLTREDAKKVLEHLNVFSDEDINEAADAVNGIPIRKLYALVETAKPTSSGKDKIKLTDFHSCIQIECFHYM